MQRASTLLRKGGFYLVAILVLPGALIGVPFLALLNLFLRKSTDASEGFDHATVDGSPGL
jgi:hypothetical protein